MKILHKWRLSDPLKLMTIVLIGLGIFFRVGNLDLKPYWYDETYTSLQISGYGDLEVRQQVNGNILTVADLQTYQYPSSEKSVSDTVRLIAQKEPQLTPLYFIFTRFWVAIFGNSVAVARGFSVFSSLLSMLLIYWLGKELFQSQTVGLFAVALFAVSPFHILYAQEARPYSLWTTAILGTNLALLRAMRLQTIGSWLIYALTSIFGLYTHLFALLVSFSQGVYVVIAEKLRLTKNLICYVVSMAVVCAVFLPWAMILFPNLSAMNGGGWQAEELSPAVLVYRWVRNLGQLFADFNINESSPKLYLLAYLTLLLGILIIVGYAIYFLCRNASKQAWLLVLTLIIVPSLPLLLQDLISGGARSTISRYLIPSFLGVQLAVAYLFATHLTQTSIKWTRVWKGIIATVLSVSVVSCLVMVQAELWWNKDEANYDRQLAHLINQEQAPLLVSDAYFAFVLSISHSLDPNVQVLLAPENTVPTLTDVDSETLGSKTFLYRPSQTMLDGLQQQFALEPVAVNAASPEPEPTRLWKLGQRLDN
ncbi:MAG: hypothetical protein Kow00121_67850 [Elainellaceae cyanobacterium]